MKQKGAFIVHIRKLDIENISTDIKDVGFIRNSVSSVLKAEKQPLECDISVVLTSNKIIRELNYQYRKTNQETDVLCFPYSSRPPFRCDIVISVEKAFEQCEKYNNTFIEEIAVLVIHGILHLLGWQDDTNKLRQKMYERQNKILQMVKM